MQISFCYRYLSTATAWHIVAAGASYLHNAFLEFHNAFYTMNIELIVQTLCFQYIVNPVSIIQRGLYRQQIHVNKTKCKMRKMPAIYYGGYLLKASHS